jgi:hypothetical protein
VSAFDPWTVDLDELSSVAHELSTPKEMKMIMGGDEPLRQATASVFLEILQARATLEAAAIQRQATEAQTWATKKLVKWTWILALATIALAAAAIVALFLGA